ncbi:MAG TPA: ABC transporter ATP-binding protein [Polyangiaceae bacterium]
MKTQPVKGDVLLSVKGLKVQFRTDHALVRAVDGVSYEVRAGETLAVVGESGSGKSVTAMSILRLIESQGGSVAGGSIEFGGKNLLALSETEMRRVRGNQIAMIFQEPMTSLNPVYTIGNQIGETLRLHRGMNEAEARQEAIRLLRLVQLPDPEQRLDGYPHQLSGGMRQRVMIAMALSCQPKLLIADEPTTALDVTVQAQILELMQELQERLGMAILLITHDLGVVATNADQVAVMYAGRIVERAPVVDLFESPKHPYTAGLLASLPQLDKRSELIPIAGNVPDASRLPSGCPFHPRCAFRLDICDRQDPPLRALVGDGSRASACHYVERHPGAELLPLLAQKRRQEIS